MSHHDSSAEPSPIATESHWLQTIAEAHATYQRSMTESHLSFLRLAEKLASAAVKSAETVRRQAIEGPASMAFAPVESEPQREIAAAPEPAAPESTPTEPQLASSGSELSESEPESEPELASPAPEPAVDMPAPVSTSAESEPTEPEPALFEHALFESEPTEPEPEPEPTMDAPAPPSDTAETEPIEPALPEPEPEPEPAPSAPISSSAPIEPAPSAVEPVAEPAPVFTPEAETIPAPRQPDPEPVPSGVDMSVLLEVVAAKTGYPVEMLESDMDLDDDLGIGSLKKVEILAAIRQRVEGLPAADSPEMAELFAARTLDDIAAAIDGSGSRPGPAPVSPEAVRTMAAPAGGLAMASLHDGPVFVVDGGSGLAEAVATGLTEYGITALATDGSPVEAARLVLLGGMTAPDERDATAIHREALGWARTAAPAMGEGGVFVTVQDTGGDFGDSGTDPGRAWLGGLAGLTRTAAWEWPGVSAKAVDCRRGDRDDKTIANAIVTELLTGGATLDVGLAADGARRILVDAAVPDVGDPIELRPGSVIAVTGDARDATATALRALATAIRPKLVLFGRTAIVDEPDDLAAAADEAGLIGLLSARAFDRGEIPVPVTVAAEAREVLTAREIRRDIAELRDLGAEVRYFAIDAADADAMSAALAEVRRAWGPVNGIIHAAGVLADKRIADLTDENLREVLATKVDSLRLLLAATASDPLDLLCVFSPVAAGHGNPGPAADAMADEVLNQVARAEQARRPVGTVRVLGTDAFAAALGATDEIRPTTDADESCLPAVRATRAQVVVTSEDHLHLADHEVAGVPMLPVAQAVEWLGAMARTSFPRDRELVLRDIAVLSRVDLPDLFGAGHRLSLDATPSPQTPGQLDLRLSEGAEPCYRAVAVPAGQADLSITDASVPAGLEPLNRPETYDGAVLFHGPGFQSLRGPVKVGASGALASVLGLRSLGWSTGPWLTDPAAIDGACQLALLWAEQALGVATLPTAVEEFRLHHSGPIDTPLWCLVRAVTATDSRAVCDIALFAEDGTPWAQLIGVELTARPQYSRP